ncbi:Rid family hydrolase [Actinomadura sp. WMMB 499]|uniref:Rid family hydrolase n=1 Tax=Actinomadura sp. WMMB 499 TaxID=1219491 RepID=UPI0012463990|nr:Rid family hydrolase [Actinomadura sp. WMMB 499]QFG25703.1 hypothetical protein F7P10_35720 [Actinomadura sp. WMMB 499]
MRGKIITGGAALVALVGLAGTASAAPRGAAPRPGDVRVALPPGESNPMIANGVGVGHAVATYTASGTGPAGTNSAAPPGTPERYIGFPGGELPPGVTITEAQGLNALERLAANLKAAGLTPRDVISMRVYLANPPGEDAADFAGWNRAYRQYFANVDLKTHRVVKVPLGGAPPAYPEYPNRARPARVALEVENLPVAGWLVEVEVMAAYR